jgi:hypothetical protein
MNTESIDCRKVETGGIEKVGDFCFDEEFEHIYVWIPGMTGPDSIRISKAADISHSPRVWIWDGNEDKPTLTPSIHAPEQWHGHLVAGRLVSC